MGSSSSSSCSSSSKPTGHCYTYATIKVEIKKLLEENKNITTVYYIKTSTAHELILNV